MSPLRRQHHLLTVRCSPWVVGRALEVTQPPRVPWLISWSSALVHITGESVVLEGDRRLSKGVYTPSFFPTLYLSCAVVY